MPKQSVCTLKCAKCGSDYALEDLLQYATDYWEHVEVVMAETPCCGARVELQLSTGHVMLGRVYVAGAPQFRVDERYDAPIHVRTKQDELLVKIDDDEYRVSGKD